MVSEYDKVELVNGSGMNLSGTIYNVNNIRKHASGFANPPPHTQSLDNHNNSQPYQQSQHIISNQRTQQPSVSPKQRLNNLLNQLSVAELPRSGVIPYMALKLLSETYSIIFSEVESGVARGELLTQLQKFAVDSNDNYHAMHVNGFYVNMLVYMMVDSGVFFGEKVRALKHIYSKFILFEGNVKTKGDVYKRCARNNIPEFEFYASECLLNIEIRKTKRMVAEVGNGADGPDMLSQQIKMLIAQVDCLNKVWSSLRAINMQQISSRVNEKVKQEISAVRKESENLYESVRQPYQTVMSNLRTKLKALENQRNTVIGQQRDALLANVSAVSTSNNLTSIAIFNAIEHVKAFEISYHELCARYPIVDFSAVISAINDLKTKLLGFLLVILTGLYEGCGKLSDQYGGQDMAILNQISTLSSHIAKLSTQGISTQGLGDACLYCMQVEQFLPNSNSYNYLPVAPVSPLSGVDGIVLSAPELPLPEEIVITPSAPEEPVSIIDDQIQLPTLNENVVNDLPKHSSSEDSITSLIGFEIKQDESTIDDNRAKLESQKPSAREIKKQSNDSANENKKYSILLDIQNKSASLKTVFKRIYNPSDKLSREVEAVRTELNNVITAVYNKSSCEDLYQRAVTSFNEVCNKIIAQAAKEEAQEKWGSVLMGLTH